MAGEQSVGLGRRLAGIFYEALTMLSVLLIGFIFPQAVLSGVGLVLPGKWLWLHVFALLMLYFVWFWLHGGQTLAMKTWKLRLVGADSRHLRPLQAVLRYLAAWPSFFLFGAGILWALVDRDRQFLHDRIAGTRIVFEPSQPRQGS